MSTPEFVTALRAKIGHDSLWLSGVTAVVHRNHAEVLLVKRADDARWAPVTGIIDPGEEPAVAAEREVLEEAAVVARAVRLAYVHTLAPMTYANRDQAQFLDLTFALDYESGTPFPADGENTEAQFFPIGSLPELSESFRTRIRYALDDVPFARFNRT